VREIGMFHARRGSANASLAISLSLPRRALSSGAGAGVANYRARETPLIVPVPRTHTLLASPSPQARADASLYFYSRYSRGEKRARVFRLPLQLTRVTRAGLLAGSPPFASSSAIPSSGRCTGTGLYLRGAFVPLISVNMDAGRRKFSRSRASDELFATVNVIISVTAKMAIHFVPPRNCATADVSEFICKLDAQITIYIGYENNSITRARARRCRGEG